MVSQRTRACLVDIEQKNLISPRGTGTHHTEREKFTPVEKITNKDRILMIFYQTVFMEEIDKNIFFMIKVD